MDNNVSLLSDKGWEDARNAYKKVVAKSAHIDVSERVMYRISEQHTEGKGFISSGRIFRMQHVSLSIVLVLFVLLGGFTYAAASGKLSFMKDSKGQVVTEFVPVISSPNTSVKMPPTEEHKTIFDSVKERLQPGQVAIVYEGQTDKMMEQIKVGRFGYVHNQPYTTNELHSFQEFRESAFKEFIVPELKNGYKVNTTEILMGLGYNTNIFTQTRKATDPDFEFITGPSGLYYPYIIMPSGQYIDEIRLFYKKNDDMIRVAVSYTYAFSPSTLTWNESTVKDIIKINDSDVLILSEGTMFWTEIRENGRFTFSIYYENSSRKQLIDIAKQIVNKSFSTPN